MSKKTIVWIIAIVLICVTGVVSVINFSPSGRVRNLMSKGNRYLEDSDYDNALAEFDKAISIDPKNPEAYIGKISALLGIGDNANDEDTRFEKVVGALFTLVDAWENTGDEEYLKETTTLVISKVYAAAGDVIASGSNNRYKDLATTLMGIPQNDIAAIKDAVSGLNRDEFRSTTNGSNKEGISADSNNSDNNGDKTEAEGASTFEEFKELTSYTFPEGAIPYVRSYSLFNKLYGSTIANYEANIEKFEGNVTGQDAIDLCTIYHRMWTMYADTNQMDKAKEVYEKWTALSAECGITEPWNPVFSNDEYGRVVEGAGNVCTYSDNSYRPNTISNDGRVNNMTYDSEGRVVFEDNGLSKTTFEYSGNVVHMITVDYGGEKEITVENDYYIDETTGSVSRSGE